MSAERNDLISLLDSSVLLSQDQDCLTGPLIDLTEETKPFQSALMTIAEVDDTFGLFTSKPRSNSAPESNSETTLVIPSSQLSKSISNEVSNERNRGDESAITDSGSKEALSNISLENEVNNTVTSGSHSSRATGINDGFVNSTIGDFEIDNSRFDGSNIVASTPMIGKPSNDVFASPPRQSPIENAKSDLQEHNGDSSIESDLLDIENLSTFSISDSSDTSGTEMKRGKFDFLSPRKVLSPASGVARGKKDSMAQLFHKNISITRRVLAATNSEDKSSDKISNITSASTPLVMALRKKISEKAALQKLENRNETNAPLLSRRYFPFSHTDIDNTNNTLLAGQAGLDSSLTSPEPVKNEFVYPTPVKEYAEARKFTTPRSSLAWDKQAKSVTGVTTPTKEDNTVSRNVTAIVTPSRRSIAQPSTPSSLTRQLSTPSRSQYGSAQSLSSRTPISMRHSFSTSSSSSGSDAARRLLTLDKVGPIPMKQLVTSIKPQASVIPQTKQPATGTGFTKSTTLPRSKMQPLKALPLGGTGLKSSTSFKTAANTTITSHNLNDVPAKSCVSAPVHRKFIPPVATSSPKPHPRSTAAYTMGTPPRFRKEPIRSSGYGQQAMNTSKVQDLNVSRITNPSPRLGEANHSRFLPTPSIGNKTEKTVGDKNRGISSVDMHSSKIGRALGAIPQHTQETKENNIRQLRKPTFGK